MFSQDFRDLLSEFNANGVEYLIVGAHALAAHGHVRATKDLDVWIRTSEENASRVMAALRAFHAPLHDLALADLLNPELIFQIGVSPIRVDILAAIDGVEFSEAWSAREMAQFLDVSAPVLSREHLIRNKLASGRPQDLADVEWLKKDTQGPQNRL